MSEEADIGVKRGDVLAGKYRVEKVLGVGGMGVVVAATHLQLDQRVALKFLLPDMLDNPEVVQRFAREGRAAARIKGEHVCKVTDVGELDTGSPYLVMEYLEGKTLEDLLQKRGTLPMRHAIDYILQASEALAEAHAAGIVHRDLKPANLFLAVQPDGRTTVKVLDFGISKLGDGVTTKISNLTGTSQIMGTPNYMSPEQLKSARDVDHRSDIWSLGVILFEMLTGSVPFFAETLAEICAAVLSGAPTPLRERVSTAPLELERIIQKCLKKNPDERFASVGDLAYALSMYGTEAAVQSTRRIESLLRRAGASGQYAAVTPASARTIASAGNQSVPPDSEDEQPTRQRNAVEALAAAGFALEDDDEGSTETGGHLASSATLPSSSRRAPRSAAPGNQTGTSWGEDLRKPKKARAALLAVSGALLIAAGVAAAFVLRRPSPTSGVVAVAKTAAPEPAAQPVTSSRPPVDIVSKLDEPAGASGQDAAAAESSAPGVHAPARPAASAAASTRPPTAAPAPAPAKPQAPVEDEFGSRK